MNRATYRRLLRSIGLAASATLLLVGSAYGQTGYRVGEDGGSDSQAQPQDSTPPAANAGPVRMARFSLIKGGATWRPGEDGSWANASVNLPIRQGAQIWVDSNSRVEIQFDDGSCLRLGSGALATLQTLYSDDKGEFTEVKLNTGLSSLSLRTNLSVYQIDTPLASVKAVGPSHVRVGVAQDIEVAVHDGQAVVQGAQGKITLNPEEYLNVADANSAYQVGQVPAEDGWDRFNDQRDQILLNPSDHLPSNIGLVGGDLNGYGTWRQDPVNGWVWCPNNVDPGWRPYSTGHWVWVDPFGWTWCGSEPWGWAPYHYGTWVHAGYGWGWCPGPAQQCWSPAVVQYTSYNGSVGWCPLAPSEVHYAAFSVGVSFGNWALSFSIGSAGCYYPSGPGYCSPRRWNTGYINRGGYRGGFGPGGFGRPSLMANNRFVSRNAGFGSFSSHEGFGSEGRFGAGNAAMFRNGQGFAAPTNGRSFAGPTNVRPTQASRTPGGSFGISRQPSSALVGRSLYRAAPPRGAGRQSGSFGHAITPSRQRAGSFGGSSNPRSQSNPGSGGSNHRGRGQSSGGGLLGAVNRAAERATTPHNSSHSRRGQDNGTSSGGSSSGSRQKSSSHSHKNKDDGSSDDRSSSSSHSSHSSHSSGGGSHGHGGHGH